MRANPTALAVQALGATVSAALYLGGVHGGRCLVPLLFTLSASVVVSVLFAWAHRPPLRHNPVRQTSRLIGRHVTVLYACSRCGATTSASLGGMLGRIAQGQLADWGPCPGPKGPADRNEAAP